MLRNLVTRLPATLFATALTLFMVPGPLLAQYSSGVRSVLAIQAKGRRGAVPSVRVWPGAGTNISFIPVNERILKVWLDDPSRITIDFDLPLCAGGRGGSSNCGQPEAMIVHLRQVVGIKFPNLPTASASGLTIVTVDARNKRNVYTFSVSAASGRPEYSTLLITPDSGLDSEGGSIRISGGRRVSLEVVSRGLQKAVNQCKICPAQGNQALRSRVLNFLALARNGLEIDESAQQAGVSMALITQLAEMGAQERFSSPFPPPSSVPIPVPPPPDFLN